MIEKLRHREAFEYYYSLGDNRTHTAVAEKFTVSRQSVVKWAKQFNWQLRVQQRDIENSKSIEKRTNNEVINAKADFRKTIFAIHQTLKKNLNEFIKENEIIQITGIKDLEKVVIILDKLARLDMGLVGENIENLSPDIVQVIVASEDSKELTEKVLKGER